MEIEKAKTNAVEIARQILNDEIHMVLGCRKIQPFLECLDLRNHDDYMIFIVVDSEADPYPISEEERSQWNKESLNKRDEDYKTAVAGYEPDVKKACEKILKGFLTE